ncbi:Rpn family recombination-promoting nuclease/putative transposase [Desulfosporosinus lacus]
MAAARGIHFIELPKLLVKWRERLVSPWEDVLARWLFLLEGSENEEILKTLEEIAMQDPVLNQAMDEWEKSSDDPKIREEYYDRRKAVLDEMAAVREAELRLREAIRQSKKEGREEGREEEKKKVTKKLLKKGMDFKSISDITGMSEEEIKNLR